MEHDPSFRTRYLVLGPLGLLARSGDRRAEDRLSAILAGDPDGPVRARAAEVSAGVAPLTGALAARARDPEPRVRQAALASLIGSSEPDAVRAATEVMSSGDWSYVKTRAAALLARAPASSVIDDVLGKALGDPLVSVRGAALVALAERRAHGWSHAIRERLDDDAEDIHIRAAAAGALGAVCDRDATDRLTDLARALAAPASAADTTLGLAALVGLGALHPADIDARLTPLLAASTSASVKAAVARARSARGACP
jgi:HEAT repeat protein